MSRDSSINNSFVEDKTETNAVQVQNPNKICHS